MWDNLVRDLQMVWKQSPRWLRMGFTATIVLNSTSLASLAENIIKWKGFLLTGIDFYRGAIDPLRSFLLNFIGLSIPQWKIDFLTFYFLIWISDLRSTKTFDTSNEHWMTALLFKPSLFITTPIIFLISTSHTAANYAITSLMMALIWFQFLASGFYIFANSSLSSMLNSKTNDLPRPIIQFVKTIGNSKDKAIKFFILITAPFALVCIAAAINTGIRG